MTWIEIGWLVVISVIALANVLVGYWMGRNSAGRHLTDNPKPPVAPKKPKGPIVQDPYAEALKAAPLKGIPTMEEE